MASQGPNSGGTFASDASYGTLAWTNPGNAATSNSSFAQISSNLGPTSEYLKVTNPGFSIPAGATIDGILVEVQLVANSNSGFFNVVDDTIKLVKGGTVVGNNNARSSSTYWPLTSTYISYGGSTDLWGTTWTNSDINDSTFGVVISAKINAPGGKSFVIGRIDHVRITVYYTAGGGGGWTDAISMLLAGD